MDASAQDFVASAWRAKTSYSPDLTMDLEQSAYPDPVRIHRTRSVLLRAVDGAPPRMFDRAKQPLTSRNDITRAMMAGVALPPSRASMQAEGEGRPTWLYIVGGTLVAGGITAAIILLTGGGGEEGIPGPPGRPSQ